MRSTRGGLQNLDGMFMDNSVIAVASTWNPSDKTAAATLSNGNLTVHSASDTNYAVVAVRGTNSLSGKAYFRFVLDDLSGTDPTTGIGIANSAATLSQSFPTSSSVVCYGSFSGAGTQVQMNSIRKDNVYQVDAIAAVVVGDIIDVAVDIPNLKFWVRKNGTGNWNESGTPNPATNTGGVAFSSGTWYPLFSGFNGTGGTARFANDSSGTAPSGFSWVG